MELPKTHLLACHDCDLLYVKRPLRDGETARCPRCGVTLYRQRANSLEYALTLTLANLILFLVSNAFPLLDLQLAGQQHTITLLAGVKALYAQGFWELAVLVCGVTVVVPLLKILGLLHLLLPLHFARRPWQLARVFRCVEALHPWSMLEVYMLGILVAFVKLAGVATLVPGIALFAFAVLIVLMAAADAVLDPHDIWEKVEELGA
jgi:paraquat-inducible protein A